MRIQRQTDAEAVLRAYRLLHLLSFVLLPTFWVAFRRVEPDGFDPLGPRMILAGLSLLLFGLSFVSPWVRTHYVRLGHATVYLLTLWILIVTQLNGFSPNYAIGYYFLVSVGCIAIGLSVASVWPLVVYSISTLTITAAVMVSGPAPQVDPTVFFFSALGSAIVITIALHSRARALEALRSSEAHLSEAQRLAGLGNWEVDAMTGRMWWSNVATDLFGWTKQIGTWNEFEALLLPDEFEAVQAWRHSDGASPFPRHVCLPSQDGESRILEMRVEVMTGDNGLPRYVLGTCLDVTEQKLQERELILAKEEAEEMSRLKDAFLANMSHEIRTPLTAVIGYAELLAEEIGPGYEDLSEPIVSGGRRLLETLNSVLDLARLEAGEHQLHMQPLDARTLVEESVQLLAQLCSQKGLRLHTDLPAHPVPVLADPSALSRVLHNLLGNAIKFTDQGGIEVRLLPGADCVTLEVADSGPGISTTFLPHLFEEFQQESSGHARSHEGCGLGLTLTKRMVEAMGGSITVESTLGEGSTFYVALHALGSPFGPAGDGQATSIPDSPSMGDRRPSTALSGNAWMEPE